MTETFYSVNYEYLNYSHNQIVGEFDNLDDAVAEYNQLLVDARSDGDEYAIDACYLERFDGDDVTCLRSWVINQPD